MTPSAVAVVAVLVFGWAMASDALARRNITGPLVFSAAGYLLSNPDWGPVAIDVETGSVHLIAEVTLALVLFADAARVDVRELRADVALPVRLLGIGLPLSIVAGTAAAVLLDLPWGLALFVGASLAPTDAALSAQVIDDERIPTRLRRSLNVESGLNDGIATPVVTLALAVAASQLGRVDESVSIEIGAAFRELGIGTAVGLVVGAGGAVALNGAARRAWSAGPARMLAVLALASSSLAVTLALEGNGFIAAFVAGIAFGAVADRRVIDPREAGELTELGGELLALVVWFLFGASLLPIGFADLDAQLVLYALLSLTALRMLPVAMAVVGAGLDRPTTAFLAWFGPRGLASIVFALLALEELGDGDAAVSRAVAAVALTVAASVLLHGVTAGPGGRRYVQVEHEIAATGPRARRAVLGGGRGEPSARVS